MALAIYGFILSVAFAGQAAATGVPIVTPSGQLLNPNTSTLYILGSGFDPVAANNGVTFNDGAVGTVTSAVTTILTVTFSTAPQAPGSLTAAVTTDGQISGMPVQVAVVPPMAQFGAAAESLMQIAGAFNIPVVLAGTPNFPAGATAIESTFVSGLNGTAALAFDTTGNLYVAAGANDGLNNDVIMKVSPSGVATTFATGFSTPAGLAFDSSGNLYVTNTASGIINKVTPAGTVSTFATGIAGANGVVVDSANNVYVASGGFNGIITKIAAGGSASTFATGFSFPTALAIDASGNLYINNSGNETINKVTPAGVVSTYGNSQLEFATGLAIDPTGNLYVTGEASTQSVVGLVAPGGTLVNTFAIPARTSIAVDGSGNVYTGNGGAVMKYTPVIQISFTTGGSAVSGTDYAGLTASPLVIAAGQSGAFSGTLPADFGPSKTLTLNIGPATGAILGTMTTNTLTIVEPPGVIANTADIPPNAAALTITGAGFDPNAANDTVAFNDGAVGTVTNATGTALTVTFSTPPLNFGALTVIVTTNGQSSGAPVQVATVGTVVTASTGSLGSGVTTITINGFGFDPTPANNTVTFNDGAVGYVSAASTTQLTVTMSTLPANLGNLSATVVSNGKSSGALVQVATITPAAAPTTAVMGVNPATVTINGYGFDPTAANNSVIFNHGAVGRVTAASTTQLTVSLTTPPVSPGVLTGIVTTDGFSSGIPVPLGLAYVFPTVQFGAAEESLYQSTGAFNIAATITGIPNFAQGATPTASTISTSLSLGTPNSLAFDPTGNLYVASSYLGQIYKIPPGGFATMLASGFSSPAAIVSDSAGYLYVADAEANSISKIAPNGAVSTFVKGSAANGLLSPVGLAIDGANNLYASTSSSDAIYQITPAGTVNTYATGLNQPGALAFDPSGNLYAVTGSNAVTRITPAGTISTFASGFANAAGLAFDASGDLYVTDSADQTLSEVTPDGVVHPFASQQPFRSPAGLVFDASGNLFVGSYSYGVPLVKLTPTLTVPFTTGGTAVAGVDYAQVVSPLTISAGQTTAPICGILLADPGASPTLTFNLGTPTGAIIGSPATNTLTIVEPVSAATVQFSGAGETVNESIGSFSIPVTITGSPAPTFAGGASATASTLYSGSSAAFLAFDSNGNLYLSNPRTNSVSEVSPTGVVTSFNTNGNPEGLAFDSAGNLYIASQTGSNSGLISKMTPGGAITTFATGFIEPDGLAFDAAGNLYVADLGTDTISKITPAGLVTPFLSNLNAPYALAFDTVGNLYVSTQTLSSAAVLKITPSGTISNFVSGPGSSQILEFEGLASDATGNLYVADSTRNTVSKVRPDGVVNIISTISSPGGLAFDSAGNLYVANSVGVSKLSPSVSVQVTIGGSAMNFLDYEGIVISPLVFSAGQTSAAITGELNPDPGSSRSLTLSLNTPIGVTVGGINSNTLTIVEPPPSLASSTATLPINAATITLTGEFDPTPANNNVTFNDGAVGVVTNASVPLGGGILNGTGFAATSLTVTFTTYPIKAGPLMATISSGGQSSAQVQIATIIPVVTTVSSPVALNATTITINGFGFDPVPANNAVTLNNGAVGTVTAASSTQLTVAFTTPPAGTGLLTAAVTSDGFSSGAAVAVGIVEPVVQFAAQSESAAAGAGSFSIAVTLTGNPTFDSGVSPVVSTVGSGFQDPAGLAFDGAGNLYVANVSGGTVSKVTPNGALSTFASGFPHDGNYPNSLPQWLAFDSAGNLCVSLGGDGAVAKVTPSGSVSTFASGFSGPSGMAYDPGGNLYVLDNDNTIYKVTSTGAVGTFLASLGSGLELASGLAVDAAGNLYTANGFGASEIEEITPSKSTITLVPSFSGSSLHFDQSGNLYVCGRNSSSALLAKVGAGGALSAVISNLNLPQDFAFDTQGNVYISDFGLNTVTKYSATAIVPFTLGGTAVAGTDYTGVTVGPLTFVNGQPVVYITGTLLQQPGASKTLTFNLGTPSGAVLGSSAANTLTIVNPPLITSSAATLAENSATLTINGAGFDPVGSHNIVTFNNGAVGTVTAATATQLTVQFSQDPTSAGNLTASVSTDGQSSGSPVQVATVAAGVPALPPWGAPVLFGTLLIVAGSRLPKQRAISGE